METIYRNYYGKLLNNYPELLSEVAAWQQYRNAADRLIDWQFTTDDARIKLRQLYPVPIGEN